MQSRTFINITVFLVILPHMCVCQCAAGTYSAGTNGVCVSCPIGFYCLGGSSRPKECWSTANTSKTGSTSLSDCRCPSRYWLNRLDAAWVVATVKVDRIYNDLSFQLTEQVWSGGENIVSTRAEGTLARSTDDGLGYITGNARSSVVLNRVGENFTVCHVSKFVRSSVSGASDTQYLVVADRTSQSLGGGRQYRNGLFYAVPG